MQLPNQIAEFMLATILHVFVVHVKLFSLSDPIGFCNILHCSNICVNEYKGSWQNVCHNKRYFRSSGMTDGIHEVENDYGLSRRK